MQIILHQTHHMIGSFGQFYLEVEKALKTGPQTKALHLFPELFLTGYPLQDLCLQETFIENYEALLKKLEKLFTQAPHDPTLSFLMGGIEYVRDEDGEIAYLHNALFQAIPGEGLSVVYRKRLLPSYDIFDEGKYFKEGQGPNTLSWCGQKIGLLICEDMWVSSHYDRNPLKELVQEGPLDLLINLSASPFDLSTMEKRYQNALLFSKTCKAPLIYVNRVGGEDGIVFDGQSFIINQEKVLCQLKAFEKESYSISFPFDPITMAPLKEITTSHEEKLKSSLRPVAPQKKPSDLSDHECHLLIEALCFGFREYADRNGFKKFVVALSGGIDSGLVLALLHLAKKPEDEIEAIYMPSQFSATLSCCLSEELCKNLGIKLYHLPIKFLHKTVSLELKNHFKEEVLPLTDENLQARLRGVLLYAHSNQKGAMVVNTSNKSELAVGYSTQYGDSVGAISLLGDLYKTQVFRLCRYINEHYGNLIPVQMIERPPSAELRADQKDEDSLPPYEMLDDILSQIINYRASVSQLVQKGYKEEIVKKIVKLYFISEYKRYQFCPIIRVQSKSFGFGYRVPLTKAQEIYTNC